jgi:UDP-N-acetylmuramoyl-tripeptide--D-alanyl-D-alanine ligase
VSVLTVADVLEALTGIRPAEGAERPLTDAAIDSRQVNPGALFVALPGEKVDGHDYVADAFQRGAILALVHRELPGEVHMLDLRRVAGPDDLPSLTFPLALRVDDSLKALQQIARFWRRKLKPRVIGITGSVGKSTTKEVVAAVLNQRYRTLKNPGNLNNEIGLPLTLLRLDQGHQRAVLEMGLYVPGEIAFLCDLAQPHIGVITIVGTVHAERAGSIEAIACGKAELVQALPPAPEGVAVLNYDDPWVRQMADQTQARVFFYDLWADQVEGLGLEGIRFRLHYQGERLYLKVPLIGRHSVHTVLRAAAVGLIEGLSWQEIVDGLRSGRMELRLVAVPARNGALILDDTYNASPPSVLAALNLLDELDGRKVAVLGDMLELGPYEQQGHERVGIRAAEVVDVLVTVGSRGKLIAAAARKAGLHPDSIQAFDEPTEAIAWLQEHTCEEDVILVKGSRGMRMERIVGALEAPS